MTSEPGPARSDDVVWHGLDVAQVAAELGVAPEHGLSAAEVSDRLSRHGPNRLAEKKKETGWQAFLCHACRRFMTRTPPWAVRSWSSSIYPMGWK